MLRASNIQYEMADRTQAMNCGGRTKFSSISLANTKEVLDLVNRPGNAVSHSGCVERIERAMELVQPVAGTVTVRGDTDFTNTAELDRWDDRGWRFLLGIDAHPKLVKLADEIAANAWRPLQRLPQYEILTEPRQKPHRYKEEIVEESKRKIGFRQPPGVITRLF
jgi:hypothetical protein